ncbi:MAG: hypothetical protein K6A30_01960, partial [Lachnospiraceae bacterium]|nr:hypothetical protein [Lachnospiraceae bacterium]
MKKTGKRILSWILVVVLVAPISYMDGWALSAKAAGSHSAQVFEVSDTTTFLSRMSDAVDGDVIRLTSDISMDNDTRFSVPQDCLVTLDLNGKTINEPACNNNFGVGANSALLIKNGTIGNIDTNESDSGVLILSQVTVTGYVWLGTTQAWLVNGTSIGILNKETGSFNPGKDTWPIDAPAIVGSGATWMCGDSLQADFDQANSSSTYNNIIMLKDDSLTLDSTLSAGGINYNLGGYTLTTGSYTLTIDNSSGTNKVNSGTITGDLNM